MLGSWSFGDYFKKEACQFAWEQLTEVFHLDHKKLYVTYYGGKDDSGLEPDYETREIWLEIGVPESRVLPFGAKDNLWEMGPTGPCGPCTEIHYDFMGRSNVAERVNAGHPDLIELWNLVFIQFERHEDGSLSPLPSHHVDTGMGLERLASVLQGVTSTYDTDIFQPLFDVIQKSSGAPQYGGKFGSDDKNGLDSGYRILADHSRMITVAIADGMLPDHNHRLRRVIRRALTVSREVFLSNKDRAHQLLCDLCSVAAESLEGAYPGLVSRLECIRAVLMHEDLVLSKFQAETENIWEKNLLKRPQLAHIDIKSSPGLLRVIEELEMLASRGLEKVDDEKAFLLYDTYGLNEATLRNVGAALGLELDVQGLHRKLEEARERSRKCGSLSSGEAGMVSRRVAEELRALGIPPTRDQLKYCYHKDASGSYQFESVEAVVQAIICGGSVVSHMEVEEKEILGVVLDQTSFYHESGGQVSDTGFIIPVKGNGFKMLVQDVQKSSEYVIHWALFQRDQSDGSVRENHPRFQVGDLVKLYIDKEHRINMMRNHTAVHCLGAAIRHSVPAIAQRSSLVTPTHLSYQFSVYGMQTSLPNTEKEKQDSNSFKSHTNTFSWRSFLESAENKVRQVVSSKGAPVRRKTMSGMQLLDEMSRASSKLEEIATVPGEVYPESGVHLVEIMISPDSNALNHLVGNESEDVRRENALLTWSREPCCGTHVLDATDIMDFCLIDVESAGSNSRIVKAVTGPSAISAHSRGGQLLLQIKDLSKRADDILLRVKNGEASGTEDAKLQLLVDSLGKELKVLLKRAKRVGSESFTTAIPYMDRCHALELLSTLEGSVKEYRKEKNHQSIDQEMSLVVESLGDSKFLVHCLHYGAAGPDKVLQKAMKLCPKDLPVLVLAAVDGGKSVKARCVVPKEIANEKFNAETWMEPVMNIFRGAGSAPKGHNPHFVFNMKERKLPANLSREESLKKFDLAQQAAQEFANEVLLKSKINT
ncbi:alanine--tRNA ligase, mitochondrial isoform X2 [Hetaerina americana]